MFALLLPVFCDLRFVRDCTLTAKRYEATWLTASLERAQNRPYLDRIA
jgi:hypothetical protein